MRNSAGCGTPQDAEIRTMRNSASCGTPHGFPQSTGSSDAEKESQYSAKMRNSALDFRFLRSIGTLFPFHAEFRRIGIFADFRKIWKSNVSESPHLTSFIFLIFFIIFSARCGNVVPILRKTFPRQNLRKMKVLAEI